MNVGLVAVPPSRAGAPRLPVAGRSSRVAFTVIRLRRWVPTSRGSPLDPRHPERTGRDGPAQTRDRAARRGRRGRAGPGGCRRACTSSAADRRAAPWRSRRCRAPRRPEGERSEQPAEQGHGREDAQPQRVERRRLPVTIDLPGRAPPGAGRSSRAPRAASGSPPRSRSGCPTAAPRPAPRRTARTGGRRSPLSPFDGRHVHAALGEPLLDHRVHVHERLHGHAQHPLPQHRRAAVRAGPGSEPAASVARVPMPRSQLVQMSLQMVAIDGCESRTAPRAGRAASP